VLTQDKGIVLKSFLPNSHKICLLTHTHGKMNFILRPSSVNRVFSPGTILSLFFYPSSHSASILKKFAVESVPIEQAKRSLYWLHHILEICYYFVPLASPSTDIFETVRYCFFLEKQISAFGSDHRLVQRACLVRLLKLIGFYPGGENHVFDDLFECVVAVSLDSTNFEKVRSVETLLSDISHSMIEKIDRWVLICLQTHPCIAKFKTISFLKNSTGKAL